MKIARFSPVLLLLLLAAGGAAGARAASVRFENNTCFIDNVPAGIEQVEREETLISLHTARRQPLFLLVTIMVVILACAGYVLRIIDVVTWRGKDGLGFTDRLRQSLERHRAHPMRYFTMVAGTFALLLVACAFYVSLDSDKRANERALGLLQFCHLALRTADERNVLSEQQQNLQALSATAGHIRALVDKLPPDEQKKAQLVIDQVSRALDRQGKTLSDSLDKNVAAAAQERSQTELVERGLSNVAADVLTLKSVPASLTDLEKTEKNTDAELDAVGAKLDKGGEADAALAQRLGAALDAVNVKLDKGAEANAALAQKLGAALDAVDAKLDKSAQDLAALAKRLDAVETRARPQSPGQPSPAAAKPF